MTTYTLYLDAWNQPPVYSKENWIIGRSMDEAVEMASAVRPDRIVFGNAPFEEDFIDWMLENGLKVPVEFIMDGETLHREKIKKQLKED